MLTQEKTYTSDDLNQMMTATKATEAGRDLALKDATSIYHNGPISGGNVARVAGNLRKLRTLNDIATPVDVIETTQIPRGAMVYFAGDKLFAFSVEPADVIADVDRAIASVLQPVGPVPLLGTGTSESQS